MLYIGIDLGTSAVKLLLVDEQGQIRNEVTKEYPLEFPKPGWSQQNPEDWKKAVFEGIPELLNGFDASSVMGIGCGGQMHGLVVMDDERYMQGLDVQDFYSVALSFFQFWQSKERDFLIAVVRSGLSAQLMDKFYAYLEEIFSQMQLDAEVASYAKSFLAGGLYKMLIDWVKNDTRDSPEAMAAFLAAGSEVLTKLR